MDHPQGGVAGCEGHYMLVLEPCEDWGMRLHGLVRSIRIRALGSVHRVDFRKFPLAPRPSVLKSVHDALEFVVSVEGDARLLLRVGRQTGLRGLCRGEGAQTAEMIADATIAKRLPVIAAKLYSAEGDGPLS